VWCINRYLTSNVLRLTNYFLVVAEKYDFLETSSKVLQEYLANSTIQGLSYIFNYSMNWTGRGFWILAVFLMMTLGVYWNVVTFVNWKNEQVKHKTKVMLLWETFYKSLKFTLPFDDYSLQSCTLKYFRWWQQFPRLGFPSEKSTFLRLLSVVKEAMIRFQMLPW
jgi:hypothetical protein